MMPFDTPWWFIAFYVFALGCVVGSFLNVCVHRIPMHYGYWKPIQGLWSPPSRCPKCFTPIRSTDNIPIFGWLRLRGRCRQCRTKISWQYPAIELLNGLLVVALYFIHVPVERWTGLSDSLITTPLGPLATDSVLNEIGLLHARFAYHWLLCELLLVASLIDFKLTIIPKVMTDPWIAVGIAGSAIGGLWLWPIDFSLDLTYGAADPELIALMMDRAPSALVPAWATGHPALHGIAVSVAGALTGGLTVWAIRTVGTRIIGIEAVGEGDVWLMAMVGSFLGWQPVLIAMGLSLFYSLGTAIVCLFVGKVDTPYGPYLSLGSVTTIFAWPWIWPRAAPLFDLGPAFLASLGMIMLVMLAIILWLLQIVKRMLGIDLYGDLLNPHEVWRASDQHMYQAGERPTETVGQWNIEPKWNGQLSGRGQFQERQWRGR